MGEGRGLDAYWEYVDRNRPVGDNELKIAAMKTAFTGKITSEIECVISGLEAHEIVFAEQRNEPLVVRQRSQYFWGWARDVKEKSDAILMSALAQCLGEWHQVIIMHPDEVIWSKHLVQLAGKVIIDP